MKIKQISGPILLIIPILLTATIGIYFNNFNNNGFSTPAVAGFSGCPTLILWNSNLQNPEICQAYNQTYTGPCQTPNNATLCGFQTPSVLNPNSVYTCILTVSWQCFINGITGANTGPAPQPFVFFNQESPPVFSICGNYNSTGVIGSSVINSESMMFTCSQINASGHKVTANITTDWASQYNCTNFSKIGFGGNYVYFACNFIPSHIVGVPVNNTWSAILSFNSTNFDDGNMHGYYNCIGGNFPFNFCQIRGSELIYVENSTNTTPTHDVLDCPKWITNVNRTNITPECQAWYNAVLQENGGSGSNIFFFSQILAIIGGIALLLIGLGLGFSGGALTFNFSITPNSQGTRYAQILGFALLFIVPIDAEFSGPFNVLSVLGIGSIILALFAVFEILGIAFMVAEPAVSH